MPPKKGKGKKAAAEPATTSKRSTRGSKAAAVAAPDETPLEEQPTHSPVEQAVEAEVVSNEPLQSQLPPSLGAVASAIETVLSPTKGSEPPAESMEEDTAPPASPPASLPDVEMTATGSVSVVPAPPAPSGLTMEQRQAKLDALRGRMQSASQANQEDLVGEHQRQMTTARDLARIEKQRKLAALLREKADAEDAGIDSERKKNWEWTIEENDAWERKLKKKARRADFEFHDEADAARKRYKKDLDYLKPDMEAYTRQKEAAMGLVPGALSKASSSKDRSLVASSSSTSASALAAAEDLYRDANTLAYGDNKPSEDAIDRVVSKMNLDIDKKGKFSRRRTNEDDGDITYINEHNKVFNKKIARYYDKYTKEIRDSFERGTAL